MNCHNCINCRTTWYDCHVSCSKPVEGILKIGAGGDERYVIAEKAVILAKEKNIMLAVRCIWPSSGIYPFNYDGGTIFACANFEEGKPIRGDPIFSNKISPILGELRIAEKPITTGG